MGITGVPGEYDGAYEARYGWNRRSFMALGGCLPIVLIGLFAPLPLGLRVVLVGVFGIFILMTVGANLTRRVALRVDAAGVTTNTSPLSPNGKRFCPWGDVEAIAIWTYRPNTYVGVVPRAGAGEKYAPLTRNAPRAIAVVQAAGLPFETTANLVGTAGWVLHAGQLTAAVARFAPGIQVLDRRTR